jgi:NAD(P)H-dependent FMN reductase
MANRPQLHVIIASTRPGRIGLPIATWFHGRAQQHPAFETKLVDLEEIGLPLLDEPHHPKLQKYTKDHTKKWAASVASADAFVFVTPEYNHGPAPALANALDYLMLEWAYKPAAFVSYGGVSGGLRSVQAIKPCLTALKMMPIPEAVVIPFFPQHMVDGVFAKDLAPHELAVTSVLDELARWTTAMKTLRG